MGGRGRRRLEVWLCAVGRGRRLEVWLAGGRRARDLDRSRVSQLVRSHARGSHTHVVREGK